MCLSNVRPSHRRRENMDSAAKKGTILNPGDLALHPTLGEVQVREFLGIQKNAHVYRVCSTDVINNTNMWVVRIPTYDLVSKD